MQELQEWENLCLHHCPSRSRLQRTCLPCHRAVAHHHSISVISSSRNRASRPYNHKEDNKYDGITGMGTLCGAQDLCLIDYSNTFLACVQCGNARFRRTTTHLR